MSSEAPTKGRRGRKQDDTLEYSRSREVQRAFRARRAAHLANLEARVAFLERENKELRRRSGLPEGGPPLTGKEPEMIVVEGPPGSGKDKGKTKAKDGEGAGSDKDKGRSESPVDGDGAERQDGGGWDAAAAAVGAAEVLVASASGMGSYPLSHPTNQRWQQQAVQQQQHPQHQQQQYMPHPPSHPQHPSPPTPSSVPYDLIPAPTVPNGHHRHPSDYASRSPQTDSCDFPSSSPHLPPVSDVGASYAFHPVPIPAQASYGGSPYVAYSFPPHLVPAAMQSPTTQSYGYYYHIQHHPQQQQQHPAFSTPTAFLPIPTPRPYAISPIPPTPIQAQLPVPPSSNLRAPTIPAPALVPVSNPSTGPAPLPALVPPPSSEGPAFPTPEEQLFFLQHFCGISTAQLDLSSAEVQSEPGAKADKQPSSYQAFCVGLMKGVKGTGMLGGKKRKRGSSVAADEEEGAPSKRSARGGCCGGGSQEDEEAALAAAAALVTVKQSEDAKGEESEEECCGGLIDCSGPAFDPTPSGLPPSPHPAFSAAGAETKKTTSLSATTIYLPRPSASTSALASSSCGSDPTSASSEPPIMDAYIRVSQAYAILASFMSPLPSSSPPSSTSGAARTTPAQIAEMLHDDYPPRHHSSAPSSVRAQTGEPPNLVIVPPPDGASEEKGELYVLKHAIEMVKKGLELQEMMMRRGIAGMGEETRAVAEE
ncbi:hypothetical protein JCM1841_002007 [Sporobolomyces salmonicolor]